MLILAQGTIAKIDRLCFCLYVCWLVSLRITTAYHVMRKTVEVAFKGSPTASVGIANRKRCRRSAVRFLPEAGDFSLAEHHPTSVAPCSYLFYWHRWSLPRGKMGVDWSCTFPPTVNLSGAHREANTFCALHSDCCDNSGKLPAAGTWHW